LLLLVGLWGQGLAAAATATGAEDSSGAASSSSLARSPLRSRGWRILVADLLAF